MEITNGITKSLRWRKNVNLKNSRIWFVVGFVAVIAALLAVFSLKIIKTGEIGVLSEWGQVKEQPLTPGTHWVTPFISKVDNVSTKQQDYQFEDKVWAETKNRTDICYANITITASIKPERAVWLVSNVGDWSNPISYGMVSSAIKSSSKTLEDEVATDRSQIEPLSQTALQSAVDEKYGKDTIEVIRVVIVSADFKEEYTQAIEAKNKAKVDAETQAIENQRSIDQATAEAEAKKVKAQGDAEALKIESEAQAEANKVLAESLTPEVLTDKKLDKWDGKLPQVTGTSGGVMIDLTSDASANTTE